MYLPAVAILSMVLVLGVLAGSAEARKTCRTSACKARVWHKHQRAVVRPYLAWLNRVARCESGGNYRINTGNGYFGAYQFDRGTWFSVGGRGLPSNASRLEQDYRAVLLLRSRGRSPWPVCGYR